MNNKGRKDGRLDGSMTDHRGVSLDKEITMGKEGLGYRWMEGLMDRPLGGWRD